MRGYEVTVNFASAKHLVAITRSPSQEGEPVVAGRAVSFVVYHFSPAGGLPKFRIDGGAEQSFSRDPQTEEISETVTFKNGWADISRWDLFGRTRLYRDDYRLLASRVASVSYRCPFVSLLVSLSEGEHTIEAYYGNYAAPDAIASLSVTAQAEAGVDPTEDQVQDQTRLALELSGGPYYPGKPFLGRAYYYHPSGNQPHSWIQTGLSINDTTADTATIPEEVVLNFGEGTISRWDVNGRNAVQDSDFSGVRYTEAAFEYDIDYVDYLFEADRTGDLYLALYYDDAGMEAEVSSQISVIARPADDYDVSDDCTSAGFFWYNGGCHAESADAEDYNNQAECQDNGGYWYNGSCHPDPADAEDYDNQAECEAAGYYWYNGACHPDPAPTTRDVPIFVYDHHQGTPVAGASVYIDSVFAGTTNSEGYFTASSLNIGQTYALRITASGYADSDEDELSNDEFTVS